MNVCWKLRRALEFLRDQWFLPRDVERNALLLGRMLSQRSASARPHHGLGEVEFRVFSQWGDDGIIQWLKHNLEFPSETFIEFGVEDYREATTRFLLMNDNWRGLVMDGSARNIRRIRSARWFWRHDLTAEHAWVDAENVNPLVAGFTQGDDPGILHIDVDGNDYWIWKSLNVCSPRVVIVEYNAVFGAEAAVTVPYDPLFLRARAHHSHLYFGASLAALQCLAGEKGYALAGSNSAGNNAYFVRRDLLNDVVRERSVAAAFADSRFRESRDTSGRLTYRSGAERLEMLRGLPVVDVRTGETRPL